MSSGHWDSSVRKFGHYEDEEEEWAPYARPAPEPVSASTYQFGHEDELARQREAEEAEEDEREKEREFQERVAHKVEQERLSRLIASGQARHVDMDAVARRQAGPGADLDWRQQ